MTSSALSQFKFARTLAKRYYMFLETGLTSLQREEFIVILIPKAKCTEILRVLKGNS